MTKEDLKNLIKNALNVPVYDDGQSITFPSATCDVYESYAALHGDGKAVARYKGVAVNLWYLDEVSRDEAVNGLLSALDSAPGVTSPDVLTTFDTNARKWRATLNLEMI